MDNIGFGNLKLYQDREGFKFSVDAVILADFAAKLCSEAESVVDLGTGNGIIPFILSHKNRNCRITGIDVQEKSIRMADMSCRENGLEERIRFIREDVSNLRKTCPDLGKSADLVVSNPPYFTKGAGLINSNSGKYTSRHETTATLNDFVEIAAWILRDRGHLCMVHRPSRLVDILTAFRDNAIEPKDIRFVNPRRGEIPNIVLVHGVLGGGKELEFMKELSIYDESGGYSAEILEIYEKKIVENISKLCNNDGTTLEVRR
ncbi:MAG: tRNA1(Val) (adenine(37)-N6)-methyltransferase [Lentihominibacter sp.]|jgi:tRNA1Val (adenine37-N6)-methyltransferase